ncbi:MAG TPA: V-type ATP synthase subunit E family protein [Sedimentisphaerales bacterium]|nr:V-type ATP synthase subunit E family protein [Sedimentisphaerales bacterium]
MEAQQVIEKILSEAKDQAQQVNAEGQKKRSAQHAELDQELDSYKKETDALAQKAAADKKAHLLAAARMEISKQFLAEKRRLLHEVFEQARRSVEGLADSEYVHFWTALILKAVQTGKEEVIVDKNETRLDQEFIKQVNRQLGPGYQGNLRLADKKEDIGGGFVLRNDKIKNNLSLKVLLEQARSKLEIDLAKDLFS